MRRGASVPADGFGPGAHRLPVLPKGSAILRYKVAIDVPWTPDLRCLHNRVFQRIAIVGLYMSFPHSVI